MMTVIQQTSGTNVNRSPVDQV